MSYARGPVFAEMFAEDTDVDNEEDAQGKTGEKDRAVVSAEVSDMDYLKSRMTKALSDDEDDNSAVHKDVQARDQAPATTLFTAVCHTIHFTCLLFSKFSTNQLYLQ